MNEDEDVGGYVDEHVDDGVGVAADYGWLVAFV